MPKKKKKRSNSCDNDKRNKANNYQLLCGLLNELYENILECEKRIAELMLIQTKYQCPCSVLYSHQFLYMVNNCLQITSKLRDNAEQTSLWLPLMASVDRVLVKAQRCIRDCRPMTCHANCTESCSTVRVLTIATLEASRLDPSPEIQWRFSKKILKFVLDNPRLVMCDCFTHLNSLTLTAYMHMANLVVHSFIFPLFIAEGTLYSSDTTNPILEEGSLHRAALTKNILLAQQAIRKGHYVNRWDSAFNTALHIATILEDFNMVKLLTEAGADPCALNAYGTSPLLLATITQQYTLLDLICGHGILLWKTNKRMLSPFLVALSLRDKRLFDIMVRRNTMLKDYVELLITEEGYYGDDGV